MNVYEYREIFVPDDNGVMQDVSAIIDSSNQIIWRKEIEHNDVVISKTGRWANDEGRMTFASGRLAVDKGTISWSGASGSTRHGPFFFYNGRQYTSGGSTSVVPGVTYVHFEVGGGSGEYGPATVRVTHKYMAPP